MAPASRIRPGSLRIPVDPGLPCTGHRGTWRPRGRGARPTPRRGLGYPLGRAASGRRVIRGWRKGEKKFGASAGAQEPAALGCTWQELERAPGAAPGRGTRTEGEPWRPGLGAGLSQTRGACVRVSRKRPGVIAEKVGEKEAENCTRDIRNCSVPSVHSPPLQVFFGKKKNKRNKKTLCRGMPS